MSTNSVTIRKDHSTTSSSMDKNSYGDSHGCGDSREKLVIGLTAEQLKIARETKFWKAWRIALVALFWLLWAGMVAGTVVIIVLKNGDAPKTTTVSVIATTTHK
ncbi:hypothetical protein GCK32_010943 [Trichostrongylus colubriformis]|uniref:Solute carrier family 3 member 2 N-terminal domain-containing protein n=1 Tax=Trichostrongylus colubriformis TaxID=6319 RepID=A0AAN8F4Q3_TRICO